MAVGDRINETGAMTARAQNAINRYRGVRPSGIDADGKPRIAQASDSVDATYANVQTPLGIAMATVADQEPIEYYSIWGSFHLVEAGAAVVAGVEVMVDANGKFITATFAAGQYTQVWGRAIEGAGVDTDLFTIIFMPRLVFTPA